MAGILDKPIWSADGLTLSNVLLPVTNLYATYNVNTEWYDGTPMDDSKLDADLVYVKFEDKYLLRNMDYGQVLQKDTMDDMRALSTEEILLLRLGVYKHVQLNGYYEDEPKYPSAIDYNLSNTTVADDGGSVIVVGSIKLEHIFNGIVNTVYFGAKESLADNSLFINNALKTGNDVINTGTYKIKSTVVVNSHQTLYGAGHANALNNPPNNYLIKEGSFNGVELWGRNNSLRDFHIQSSSNLNTGDGVLVRSARAILNNVSSANNGGDGIRVGDEKRGSETATPNCNLFSLTNIYSYNNEGWGVRISDGESNPLQDCNAGEWNLGDVRNNRLGGVYLKKANDNTLIGVASQYNLGIGLVSEGRGNTFMNCYTEANDSLNPIEENRTDVHFTANSVRNRFMFYYSGQVNDRIKDDGLTNFVLGTSSRLNGQIYFKTPLNAVKRRLVGTESGIWEDSVDASRNYTIELTGTSSNGNVIMKTQNENGVKLVVNGQVVASDYIALGSSSNNIYIKTGLDVNPNGIHTAIAGSIYIRRGSITGGLSRVWVKDIGNDSNGWTPMSYRQGSFIQNITTANAVDLDTAISLANVNKAKINEILTTLKTQVNIISNI